MARKAAVHLTVGSVTYAPGDEVPAEVADLVDAPGVFGDADESGEDADDSVLYGAFSKGDLEAEVARRNEGRDEADLIVVGGRGNKSDLIAALEADDGN